jgi:histidine ammonia-lyase
MGSISARKLGWVVANVRRGLAVEIATAAQGIDYRRPLAPSLGVRAAHARLRAVVPELVEDRPLYKDIEAVAELISSGELARAVASAVGPLA